ncbi:MAG: DUF1566 domain-containing protein [Rhodoferax sp.]|nr:DUF1566 domain-containing protein [Rhodoferax sp.]
MRRIVVLGLLSALGCAASSCAAGLNDTGITDCSDDNAVVTTGVEADTGSHPRQDCRYGRDAAAKAGMPKVGGGGKGFDFTKIANDGTVLPETAALGTAAKDWACTRDNVTGLIWEVKTTSGLRSQSHAYSWYNSNAATNGGSVGTASGGTCFATGRCDTEKFTADVNAAGLCGASDWRMPRVKDLAGIADLGRSYPAIDPVHFPNTPSSDFWSGSPYADSDVAWSVNFVYGEVYYRSRRSNDAVRLVRGGQ